MSSERLWPKIGPLSFISNGGTDGQVEVSSTEFFKVKQKVFVKSNTQINQLLEVKAVLSETNLELGPPGSEMKSRTNLTSFLVSDSATIYAEAQNRPAIPPDTYNRAAFEEEPTVAHRVHLVDQLGRRYTESNPVPVQLSDGSINIGTVNAELETQLTHKDNYPDVGDVADSIRIGDGVDELKVNPDGSINVVSSGNSGVVETEFDEINAVASGSEEEVVSFTAPVGKITNLNKIDYSGDNIAKFTVKINGVVEDIQRTYFGNSLNGTFDFGNGFKGLDLIPGDEVKLYVIHSRPSAGSFSGRIQTIQSEV